MKIDIEDVLKLLDRKDCKMARSIINQYKTTHELLRKSDIQVTIDMLQAVLDENDVLQEYYGAAALEFLIEQFEIELKRNTCDFQHDVQGNEITL